MKSAAYVFPLTTIVIFVQAITGGMTVLGFYDLGLHETTGYAIIVLALISVGVAFGVKPKYNALRYSALLLLVLSALQAYLGYSAETSDQVVTVHFTNALLIYGVAMVLAFYSLRWGKMDASSPIPATK